MRSRCMRWLAAQPWCDGAIGITGGSWGGFNGLQIAAEAPPELKAVVVLLRERRPLRRRRPLPRRLRARPWTCCTGRLSMLELPGAAAADPWVVGDAGASGGSSGSDAAAAGGGMARAPAARCLLAARLRLRGLRRDPPARCSRSAAGRTATPTRSCGCCRGSTCRGAGHRPVGPRTRRRRPRPRRRRAAGGGALVRAVARRARQRGRGRARCWPPWCRTGCVPAAALPGATRPLGDGAALAVARRRHRSSARTQLGAPPGGGRCRRPPCRSAVSTPAPGARTATPRPLARPAGRGRPVRLPRVGAARSGPGTARLRARVVSPSPRTSRSRWLPCGSATSARTAPRCSSRAAS